MQTPRLHQLLPAVHKGFPQISKTTVCSVVINCRPVDTSKQATKTRRKTPLGGQLSSKKQINWTEEHQERLNLLTDLLMQPGVMAYPDFEKPFVLHTDASSEGLGAVLYQEQGGNLRVVGYGSRTLTLAERNYHLHSGKLEFLALKWAISDKLRDYLFYAPTFVVFTDSNPLTYIMSSAKLNATGHRWVEELADYNFTVNYRPGKMNTDANVLSRTPLDMDSCTRTCMSRGRRTFLRLLLKRSGNSPKAQPHG